MTDPTSSPPSPAGSTTSGRDLELVNAAFGPAVRAAVAMRIVQLEHGHDREADSMLAIDQLPRRAREFLSAATEQMTGEKRHLPAARRNLARTAAMCFAAIDRLDLATGGSPDSDEIWLPMDTAPVDGTKVLLRIEHQNLRYAPPEDRDQWIDIVVGRWIDFNGGGWTWYGMCGFKAGWRPLPGKGVLAPTVPELLSGSPAPPRMETKP